MEDVYPKAYVEVLEILKYIPAKEYLKIPQDKILEINKNKDKNYEFSYDINIPFENQNILKETKIILTYLINEYFLSNVQKVKLEKILNYNDKLVNDEKAKKYKYDDIFDDSINNTSRNIYSKIDNKNNDTNNKILPTEYKENFISKMINKIKSFFNKK